VLLYNHNSGCSVLHWAAGSGHVQIVEYLLVNPSILMPVDTLATKLSKGRTALHYSCRNGFLEASKCLVTFGANVNVEGKHKVSPFQLAVWQNHLHICKWLVESEGVDAAQVNSFDCGAVHWIGISPPNKEDCDEDDGISLIPLAEWLANQKEIDFHAKQRQGHTPLHKAAWGGHIALLQYLRDEHGLIDNLQDYAGNYAADIADMANTHRHAKVAKYLREECSEQRQISCNILGVDLNASRSEIRRAYLEKVRLVHPDRVHTRNCRGIDMEHPNDHTFDTRKRENGKNSVMHDFDEVKEAYEHLIMKKGIGSQSNPLHSINLMLTINSNNLDTESKSEGENNESEKNDLFKARLLAVVLEYGDKGLALCNIKKKWNQVWPDIDFPSLDCIRRKKGRLAQFIKTYAGDVVELRDRGKGKVVVPRHVKRVDVINESNKMKN